MTLHKNQQFDALPWLIPVGALAALMLPFQAAKIHPGFKLAFAGLGLVLSTPVVCRAKHQLTELEKDLCGRYKRLTDAEEDLQRQLDALEQRKQQQLGELNTAWERLHSREQQLNEQYAQKLAKLDTEVEKFEKQRLEETEAFEMRLELAEQALEQEYKAKESEFTLQVRDFNEKVATTKQQIDQMKASISQELQQERERLEGLYQDAVTKFDEERDQIFKRHSAEIEIWKERYATAKAQLQILQAPKMPRRRETMAEVWTEDIIWRLWRNNPAIKCDCYNHKQPVDLGTHIAIWLQLRDNSQITELTKDSTRNALALDCKFPTPYFICESAEGIIRVEIPQQHNYKPPKQYQVKESKQQLKTKEPPKTHFQKFLDDSHQVCLLGSTGDGKTTLIGNILGLFNQLLGGSAQLVITNPKVSESSIGELASAKYLGFKESIFGLLEAATAIMYRLWLNEKAARSGQPLPQHQPIIYFFDEYSEVAARWNAVDVKVFNKTLKRFKQLLDPDQLQVFENEIEEFLKPSDFAGQLLKFIWRVGRSEKVKSLIAGQNLMPNTLKVNVVDLLNTGIIALGDTAGWALENTISMFASEGLKHEFNLRIEIAQSASKDEPEKYFGVFKSPKSRPYFALLPAPSSYQSESLLAGETVKNSPDKSESLLQSKNTKISQNIGTNHDRKATVSDTGTDIITHTGIDAKIVPELTVSDTGIDVETVPSPTASLKVEGKTGTGTRTLKQPNGKNSSTGTKKINPRNWFPHYTEKEEKAVWKELQKAISKTSKKRAFENVLGFKGGNGYTKGNQYLEYLTQKYFINQ
ncbi:MAG: hypothetical protein QNJ47_04005 [Nostocaceae cyanobacterium]|nr:hypothetical protein [Nostocaceae cyanobacterium]